MTIPVIEIRGLRVGFGGKPVLDDLSLVVEEGESVVLIGASGTGKSVLMKAILGLVPVSAGSILIRGQEILGTQASDQSRDALMDKLGVLFQKGALFDSMSVWENVAFRLTQSRRMPPAQAKAVAVAKLLAVGLDQATADLSPAELSGGMQKRVALARAIVADPEILLLDDPVAGLDPILTAGISGLIADCLRDLRATAISITPDVETMRQIGHRIAMLDGGRIVWTGPVARMESSGNGYVDQFIHGRSSGPIHLDVA